MGWHDGVVRADRAPVASPGSAGRGPVDAVVCAQPIVTSWPRRTEDLTADKTDEIDAVLIARLTAELVFAHVPGQAPARSHSTRTRSPTICAQDLNIGSTLVSQIVGFGRRPASGLLYGRRIGSCC